MNAAESPTPDRPRRRKRTAPTRRRARVACSCHAPLPRLPRRLLAREVAYQRLFGRPWWTGPSYADAPPLTADDLTAGARGRLLHRAETRWRRSRLAHRHLDRDYYWIAAELALGLPRVPPRVVTRWRDHASGGGWNPSSGI